MNILFTNHRFADHGGAEFGIRDLAVALRRRMHRVVGFSSYVAPAPVSANEDLPIVTSLDRLPFRPDIIHAQHHVDAMTAIMTIPGVPAVYVCHGATRSDAQPKHPRILRYVAVTETMRVRMAVESNIPEHMIEVVSNPVDLDQFTRVRLPPDRPRRGYVYSRVVTPATRLGMAIREAGLKTGIDVEFLRTRSVGRRVVDPESFLLDYDLIFASGRSAIDALACGCAVIVLSGASGGWAAANCGELVDESNFARLRQANFTIPVNAPPPSADAICAEIERYTAAGTAAVARRIREVAGLDAYADRFLDIYGRVVASWCTRAADLSAEQSAASEYLRSLARWAMLADEARTDSDSLADKRQSDDWAPSRLLSRPLLVDRIRRLLSGMEGE